MSDVVEKTLTALPSLLSLDPQPGAGKLSATSKLGNLIRSVTELTSKHEEEKLIKKELSALKEQVSSPNTTLRQMKEIMVRAMYCEMLGYEASFSYIHAIKLAQQGSGLEKRVGYLAVSLFLNESHDLLLLLVNTVLKDLQSTNLIEVCMALTVVSQIFPKDMIPAVLPLVEDKLTHSKEIIRRKAVLALYKFYLIAPNQVQHIHDKFRKALCDKDPGVMTASLHIYLQMIKESPDSFKELTASLVAILKQVVGGKLPVEFNYHSVPAPWLQIQLLRMLALLGKEDQSVSELMYEVLDESLRRAEINHNITYAILYECVKTIYTIHPKSELLEKAAKCIGKFVLSPKINLKYLGLKALTYVVQQDPNLALQHQMTIIECLDHPDPIIKRETLELLYRITNGQNVSVIVQKMLDFLRQSKDEHTTIDLVGKVAELAEKYAPDNVWFIQTMNTVFSLGGDVMQSEIPNSFLRLLAEGFDSAEEDTQLRLNAVDSYLALLQTDTSLLPQRFLQVISWVLGEFSFLKVGLEPSLVLAQLARLLEQGCITMETRSWILGAMCKLCGGAACVGVAGEVAGRYGGSLCTTIRQQALELGVLCQDEALRDRVLPQNASWDGLEVDSSLSFLDGFVSDALAQGAAPYKPPHQRQEELSQEKVLHFEPYSLSMPISLSTCSLTDRQSPTGFSLSSGLSGNSAELSHKGGSGLLKMEGVQRVWGKEGYLPQKEATEEVPAVPILPPVPSQQQGGAVSVQADVPSHAPVAAQASELEQERRQLASSLFVGLGLQNEPCLMGKPDVAPQRFRRKARLQEPAGGSDKLSDSSYSSHSTVDSLLDSSPAPLVEDELSAAGRLGEGLTTLGRLEDGTNTVNPLREEPAFAAPLGQQPVTASSLGEGPNTTSSLGEGPTTDSLPGEGPSITGPWGEGQTEPPLLQCDPEDTLGDQAGDEGEDDPPEASDGAAEPGRQASPCLPTELLELPHSELLSLASDHSLALSAWKVCGQEALELRLLIRNSSDSSLQGVSVQLTSDQLKVLDGANRAIPSVGGLGTVTSQYSVVMEMPLVQAMVGGAVTYRGQSESANELQFSVGLPLTDFLRPLLLSTEDYGKLWLSFSHDVKQNLQLLPDKEDPFSATLNVLKEELRLHLVEIIGTEGIMACQLLPGHPCLLHCHAHTGTLTVWLRSSVPDLPDCLLYHCQRVLQER
ncbi:AP-4 complex subunit epsilon-1 [Anguilla anguilla]|uniref:AP-4 complex subunit epsilon-1 n=1 Tax=Anguilla anguilla TaxID=7936 RepID=UPI0015ABA4A9|nr:AP-4 complex subunit epsilon-1 [Anguilla anguilla]